MANNSTTGRYISTAVCTHVSGQTPLSSLASLPACWPDAGRVRSKRVRR